eukprot:CAMPEP_0173388816 /NCGR_PEP_ID=MMETSP1356-20130122/11035_1 /TAXON_ID=77927 ORGANISM="Hemiselmis virescens, Strain PCC157" /NCGR_SAMPLE_ID=MMETSP1356 /ASSEMBLY_ACC=CAM_ASM_000847 /LENGTH=360 /DNA_ID=CAMNT_0014345807 /DNA_START=53 /DNA_END=1135 /DNA_ORIENTATION=+
MQASEAQMTEMIVAMQSQCQYFRAATESNPKDDVSYANWGSMLMHLSMVSEDQTTKKKYLKEAIERLERAISLNPNSKTHEGELAYFNLGNAMYFNFFLEKDDATAESHLTKAKEKFAVAMAKEPGNPMHTQMIEQLQTAHEQRRAAHEQLARLEGKTDEEKKVEILNLQRQMLESVVDSHRKAVESNPTNAANKIELSKACFELAMLCGRNDAKKLFGEAISSVEAALQQSPLDTSAPWLHAILTQAQSYAETDKTKSRELMAKAKSEFDSVLRKEIDVTKREQLNKEKDIFNTSMQNWKEWQDAEAKADAMEKANKKSPAAAGKGALESGNEEIGGFVVLVGVVAAVGVAAWFLTRKR